MEQLVVPLQWAHVMCGRSVRQAKQKRCCGTPEKTLVLANCKVLQPEEGRYYWGGDLVDVTVRAGRVEGLDRAQGGSNERHSSDCVFVDCGGRVLMPGLCDAHVHCTAITADLTALTALPESLVAAKAGLNLEAFLERGFTTMRDAGGADFGLAAAVQDGTILGPRLLFTGHALSQTGGHGDFRHAGGDCLACGAALRGIGRVCDGVTEVRRAARDELRKGAHCIKIMASGGVSSPTDRLENDQFSLPEMCAIVEEAAAARTYVCAHAYMPSAIQRAVKCGVLCIEHANFMDAPTADMVAAAGVFLVPTLITYQKIQEAGEEAGMSRALVAKVGDCVSSGMKMLQLAHERGIKMCFGSDLLGDLQPHQSEEFLLRARVLPPADVLRAATTYPAQLFRLHNQISRIAPGWQADLILVDGDPLADVTVLADTRNVRMVLIGGLVGKAPAGILETINERLFG